MLVDQHGKNQRAGRSSLFERLQPKYPSLFMVRYAWIVFGAVACGTATASVFGGMSSFGGLLTLATLAVALAATAAAWLKPQPRESPIDLARLERQRLEQEQFATDLLARVDELVTKREIDWLSREDFVGAWRDTPVSSLRKLKRLDALGSVHLADGQGEAVARLVAAANRFLDYYDLNTRPDALLTGTEWREIGRGEARERPDEQQQPADGIREHLVEHASAVTRAYDTLLELQADARHPEPRRARA
jgi:hypothetical protein